MQENIATLEMSHARCVLSALISQMLDRLDLNLALAVPLASFLYLELRSARTIVGQVGIIRHLDALPAQLGNIILFLEPLPLTFVLSAWSQSECMRQKGVLTAQPALLATTA